MPNFPPGASPHDKAIFTASYVDARGERATVTIDHDIAVTDVELSLMFEAMSSVTNAGLVSFQQTKITQIPVHTAIAFDEAESSASTKAELQFQNSSMQLRTVSVPAPDASFIGTDGFTILRTGDMATLITELENVLNGGSAGTGTFSFVRGYVVNRSRRAQRGNVRPNISEPGLTDEPGDAPAS